MKEIKSTAREKDFAYRILGILDYSASAGQFDQLILTIREVRNDAMDDAERHVSTHLNSAVSDTIRAIRSSKGDM